MVIFAQGKENFLVKSANSYTVSHWAEWIISRRIMRFRLQLTTSGQLQGVWVLSSAILLMILAESGAAQKMKRKKPTAVCNENWQRSKCDIGQTCNKISSLNRSYNCFECQNCVNMRKYEEKIEPNDVFKLDEECLHIRVQCGACPACPKAAVPLVLPSKLAMTEESMERAGRMEDHEFYKYWCALVVSVAVNLLLLCIIINCRPKSAKKVRKEEVEYENVSWIEMEQK